MSASFKPKHYYCYGDIEYKSKDAFLCITVTEYKNKKVAVFKHQNEDDFITLFVNVDKNGNEYCATYSCFIKAKWELIGD